VLPEQVSDGFGGLEGSRSSLQAAGCMELGDLVDADQGRPGKAD
jgi:hypothetical protein